jgi:L-malate glycosyltransferase
MKIAFFTENYYRGGLDTVLITLINHWPYPEDELTLICNKSHPGLEVIRSRLDRCCRIKAHGLPMYWGWYQSKFFSSRLTSAPFALLGKLLSYPLFVFYALALILKFRRSEYDRLVVVNGGYPGGLSCCAASIAWGIAGKRPLSIHNFHNFAVKAPWWRKWIEDWIDSKVHQYSRSMVSVSKACISSLSNRPAFSKNGDYRFIYNGIEAKPISYTTPTGIRDELGIPHNSPLCLMLATYEPRKGHYFFLKSFSRVVAEIPNARALICGHGNSREIARMRKTVESLGLNQHVFLGSYRNDIDALFQEAQVLVVPSQSYESFGLTIIEAMARKVPVVATQVGGIPEVMGDGCGLIVRPDDAEGFANCISRCLSDRYFSAQLGERGYRRYQDRFTADRMAKEYSSIVRANDGVPVAVPV